MKFSYSYTTYTRDATFSLAITPPPLDWEMFNGSVDADFVVALPFYHGDLEPDSVGVSKRGRGGWGAEHEAWGVTERRTRGREIPPWQPVFFFWAYLPKNSNSLCHNCPTHLRCKCPTSWTLMCQWCCTAPTRHTTAGGRLASFSIEGRGSRMLLRSSLRVHRCCGRSVYVLDNLTVDSWVA